MRSYLKRLCISERKEEKRREERRKEKKLFSITIDSTRFTNTFFTASDPVKKTVTQRWLGSRDMVKRKKIKLSEFNFYKTLNRFVKGLCRKLKGRRRVLTRLRFEGSFKESNIKAIIPMFMRLKELRIVEIRDATALHLFSGIRFRKERRI
jgi:ribosomal protein S11